MAQKRRRRPATTPEARENQLISDAFDLAEKQIREGNATSQLLVHFLKQGSDRERLERERLMNENAVLRQKVENMASGKRVEELYENAIRAMRDYGGHGSDEYDDEL